MPIIDNASCKDKNIIYCLSCTKCNMHYIGETKRSAHQRFQEHLSNIRYHFNFGLFKSVVSKHFYDKHEIDTFNDHIKFSILRKNVIDIKIRRHLESDLLHVIHIFDGKLINDPTKIITKEYIRYFFFYF
jgi:hypothetical protein